MVAERILKTALGVFCLLTFAVSCGDDDGDDDDVSNAGGSLNRIAEATAQIRQVNPAALIIWGGGRKDDNSAMDGPEETQTWQYTAVALRDNGLSARNSELEGIWELIFDGDDWTINTLSEPPFEIAFVDLNAVSMDVGQAWQLVVEAGLSQPIFSWELFESLNPNYPNPQYAFSLGGVRYIFVNTVTGEVTEGERRR